MRVLSIAASLLFAFFAASCTRARAEQAVASPHALEEAKPVEKPACPADLVPWQRGHDVALCAKACTTDQDCSPQERCRVLSFDGMPQSPTADAVFADEVPEVFAEHAEMEGLAADGLLQAEPPECDDECRPYSGDLTIRPVKPVALCDPFHDERGALLSATDEEALAAEAASVVQD
jgi:hypothetical protein